MASTKDNSLRALDGFIWGAGLTVAVIVVLAIARHFFHAGIC